MKDIDLSEKLHYVAEYDQSIPENEKEGRAIVVKTTDGPGEPEPLFWTGTRKVHELIYVLYQLIEPDVQL